MGYPLQTFGPMQFRPYVRGVGTYVLFAGAESNHFRRFLLDNGATGLLYSFYYLRKAIRAGDVFMDDLKADSLRADYVYVDSGGFTLQRAVASGKLDVDLDSYIRDYYEFAEEMRPYVQVWGAVDCLTPHHKTSGTQFKWEHMDRAVYEARARGIHIAPTIFGHEDLDSLRKSDYLQNFDIVGLSGTKKSRAKSRSLFMQLQRAGMRVHGYAMTSQEEFRAYDFFSVDSSTWLGGQKYGSTYVFRGGKVRTYGLQYKTRVRPTLYQLCQDHGIDYEKVMTDTYTGGVNERTQSLPQGVLDEINKMNLVAWKAAVQHHLSITNRAYWTRFAAPVIIDSETGEPINRRDDMESANDLLNKFTAEPGPPEQATPEIEADLQSIDSDSPEESDLVAEDVELSKKYKAPLKCSNCVIFNHCDKAVTGNDCAYTFDEIFRRFGPSQAIKQSAQAVVQLQFERIMRVAMQEKANGGSIDNNLSQEISRYMNMLMAMKSLASSGSSLTITATGGAAEGASSSGGILAKLLGAPEQ